MRAALAIVITTLTLGLAYDPVPAQTRPGDAPAPSLVDLAQIYVTEDSRDARYGLVRVNDMTGAGWTTLDMPGAPFGIFVSSPTPTGRRSWMQPTASPLFPVERPTWRVGDHWTYQWLPTGRFITWTVLRVNSDQSGGAPGTYSIEAKGGQVNIINMPLDLSWEPSLVKFLWPLTIGKTWKATMTGSAPTAPYGLIPPSTQR